jgi:competence protein ComEC
MTATVLAQYKKTKETKNHKIQTYQVLKLRSEDGLEIYTTQTPSTKNLKNQTIKCEVFAPSISFYQYLTSFYAPVKILKVLPTQQTLTSKLQKTINTQHADKTVASLFTTLFLAKPLPFELQTYFSQLGISHLFAISGFHLGILSFLLYLLISLPYRYLQKHFFPYRDYKTDTFAMVLIFLLAYLLLLNAPPSLLRAYGMLVLVFFLYTQGMELISMQTLLVTITLLLSLFITLFFSLGFWLSVAGVFYIFLFLQTFPNLGKKATFLLLNIWIYLAMLPIGITIFHNFSIYHPFSIVLSIAFSIFYPIELFLHLVGFGGVLDSIVSYLLSLPLQNTPIQSSSLWLYGELIVTLFALATRKGFCILLGYCVLFLFLLLYGYFIV